MLCRSCQEVTHRMRHCDDTDVPHWPVRSITNSTAVGRCCIAASVRRSIALRSSSGRSSSPGVSVTCEEHRCNAVPSCT